MFEALEKWFGAEVFMTLMKVAFGWMGPIFRIFGAGDKWDKFMGVHPELDV